MGGHVSTKEKRDLFFAHAIIIAITLIYIDYVYYREVKSLRLKEISQNTTLTFLFGAVLTDDFLYGAVLTENWGRFNRKWGRFGLWPFSTGAVLTGNPLNFEQSFDYADLWLLCAYN